MKNTSLCFLFQFHKGTIRTALRLLSSPLRLNFNSIKVQLEPIGPLFKMSSVPTFQFHKGTIRTVYQADEKTGNLNFNSIKVQLELIVIHQFLQAKIKFQFHKGTIRTLDSFGVANPYSVISIP